MVAVPVVQAEAGPADVAPGAHAAGAPAAVRLQLLAAAPAAARAAASGR